MKNNISSEIIDIVLEQLKVGLTLVDHTGKVIYFNKLAQDLLGWHETYSNTVLSCHHPKIQGKVIDKLNHHSNREWHRIINRKGRYVENTYSPISIPEKITGAMIISKDVTAREKAYSHIEKAAHTDSLTGLFNRELLNKVIKKYEQNSKPYGLIMVDINGLKYINDHYGHSAGDEIIIKAAKTINENVRKSDLVFRIGGDEFLILTTADQKIAMQMIQRIKEKSEIPSQANPLVLSLSLGYSMFTEGTGFDAILLIADQRMYQDKKSFYETDGKFFRKE
ncbi:GGDEF domain-containing protein [Candidatus Formimonas warabiya]|uniref:GGDEF domain-containing protein n=1 Tax=Formimonas warabiya TaxID=1761012 RepID=A0A3G1KMY1_FORW1|nr:GGDEF domain-containing protein [Candidatus Formimonas warabiya]ATW23809.1 GGDEF domain-containing protein [Candidatus Formimonas warabiya]